MRLILSGSTNIAFRQLAGGDVGQGVRLRGTYPFVKAIAPHDHAGYLRDLSHLFAQAAQTLPSQADFIAQHCAATPPSVT